MADPWTEDDRPVAEALIEEVEGAELFLYPGSSHLFADSSLDDYKHAAGLLKQRTLAFGPGRLIIDTTKRRESMIRG
jgi:hypothetical protein